MNRGARTFQSRTTAATTRTLQRAHGRTSTHQEQEKEKEHSHGMGMFKNSQSICQEQSSFIVV